MRDTRPTYARGYRKCYCSKCSLSILGYLEVTDRALRLHKNRDKEKELAQSNNGLQHIYPNLAHATSPKAAAPSTSQSGSGFSPPVHPDPISLSPPSPESAASDETSLFGSPIQLDPPELGPHSPGQYNAPTPRSDTPPSRHSTASPAQPMGFPQPAPQRAAEHVAYLQGENPELFERPAGCNEPPHIRMAYLNAIASSILDRAPRDGVQRNLRGSMAAFKLIGALPDRPKPVVTLAGVLKRMGLDVEPYFTSKPMCSECYKIYETNEIENARSPVCTRPRCKGLFWEHPAGQPDVRKPLRIAGYSNIVAALRRMFMRHDFVAALRSSAAAHQKHQNIDTLFDVCDGTAWNLDAFGLVRNVSPDGTVSDVNANPDQPVSLGFGLFASLNLDWFRITDKYSVGGVYLSILNLPRSVRNLPWNVILACTIPGPGEPSLEDLNNVIQPVVEQFKNLYAGLTMRVYEQTLPQRLESHVDLVALKVHMTNNDSPARQKISGIAGHSSKRHFCICEMPLADLQTSKAYDIAGFVMRDDWTALKLAFEIRGANTTERNEHASDHGIRWSALNELPGWMTYLSAPLDLMHNLYLGIVKHFWGTLILGGFMLSTAEKGQFERFMDKVEWPSKIGRVPKNITKYSTRKADEWRRLATVLPVGLWFVWRNHVDHIETGAPRVPPDTKNPPRFNRCRKMLYDCLLQLCVACSLFGARTISLTNVHRAQTFLQWYCQSLVSMKVHMHPNHHWGMHYEPIFRRYGPAYAWWIYAFERYNGLLQKVNLNKHEGEMEATLMRFWLRMHRLYELSQFLPESAPDDERKLLDEICNEFGHRGTPSSMQNTSSQSSNIAVPRTAQMAPTQLNGLPTPGIYSLLLQFARLLWPDLNLQHELSTNAEGTTFWSDRSARRLPFITKDGIRFGCSTNLRTHRDQYAFISFNGLIVPTRLVYHFEVAVGDQAPVVCSVVQRFLADDRIPRMPWDLYAVELGIYTSKAEHLGQQEVVQSSAICAPLALCPVQLGRPQLDIWDQNDVHESGSDGDDDVYI